MDHQASCSCGKWFHDDGHRASTFVRPTAEQAAQQPEPAGEAVAHRDVCRPHWLGECDDAGCPHYGPHEHPTKQPFSSACTCGFHSSRKCACCDRYEGGPHQHSAQQPDAAAGVRENLAVVEHLASETARKVSENIYSVSRVSEVAIVQAMRSIIEKCRAALAAFEGEK